MSKKKSKEKFVQNNSQKLLQEDKVNAPRPINIFLNKLHAILNTSKFFWAVIIVLSVVLITTISKTSINASGDDLIEYQYGKANYLFYKSFGKDTSYLSCSKFDDLDCSNLFNTTEKYYSGSLYMLEYFLVNWLHPKERLLPLHIISTILTICVIICLGLIIKKLFNWTMAIIGVLFFINTPFIIFLGVTYATVKDISFMLGLIFFVYNSFLFFNTFPNNKKIQHLFFALSMFIATMGRMGSVIIFLYFFIFVLIQLAFNISFRNYCKANKKKFFINFILINFSLIIGFITSISIGSYNFWKEGYMHIINGITTFGKFSQKIPVLFNGESIVSTDLPSGYLILNLLYTLPLYVLFLFILSTFILLFKFKKIKNFSFWIITYFIVFFPIVYIIQSKAIVYDKWRHIAFIYPFIIIILLYGLNYLQKHISATFKIIIYSIVFIFFIKTFVWNIKNYPLQTAYFNEIIGGTNGAWLHQEMDSQQQGARLCFNQLLKDSSFIKLLQQRDSSNPIVIACYTLGLNSKYLDVSDEVKNKIKIINTGFKNGYSATKWDYGIFGSVFVEPEILNSFFPPKETIFEAKADDVPIAILVKRQNNYDIEAIEAIKKNNILLAIDLLEKAYNYDSNNFRIWNYYALILQIQGKNDEARKFAFKYLEFFPNDVISSEVINNKYLKKN